ncbi:MAG TPA: protocatechuate 3,4-dioxygenase subunit beta [Polyangiaceae bacterium]|nr:protocatechuate 3,4-dioxygenase subunit beta [Polyangiaceae bacterium]
MSKLSRFQALDAEAHPPYASPRYVSSVFRSPHEAPIPIRQTLSELTGPSFGPSLVRPEDVDLTTNAGTGSPAIGERIIVSGRVLEEDGRPLPNTLLEIWQCNAAGRYNHASDVHDAPLDPNFLGAGRVLTDADGCYRFTTIRPGAYPWRNHYNAWRPAHIHFSLFGPAYASRLVTQMYFPGDPLLELDGIFMSVTNAEARQRLVARFDHATSRPHYALGYRWDIVLRGREETPLEGP